MSENFDPKAVLRSPRETMEGYVFLPRLIDKVRLASRGLLPEDYHPNLLSESNRTFDGRFLLFTGIHPEELRAAILSFPGDDAVCGWVRKKAIIRPSEEIRAWSENGVSALSVPTTDRIVQRSRSYPEAAKALPPDLLASLNPLDLIDFDEGRLSFDGLMRNHEEHLRAESRPPFPPFDRESALKKVRMAEDAWNSKNPERVALAYTPDSRWRNRSEFFSGRTEIVRFLRRKWERELDYRLIKELWSWEGDRISVRFAYEWHDDSGNWFRSYGNENWEFSPHGLMARRIASINDLPIPEAERKLRWATDRRPDDHPGLSDLDL